MKALETGFLNSVSMKRLKKLTTYKLEKNEAHISFIFNEKIF